MIDAADQVWADIPEFPGYQVSNWGLIFSRRRGEGRTIETRRNNHGHLQVNLYNEHGLHTRSVAKLVAQAFVEPPEPFCDHVVLLDGVKTNVAAENLVWRPVGFAWSYANQLKKPQPAHIRLLEVTNMNTGAVYESIFKCRVTEGLLFADVWRSTYSGAYIFPYDHRYEITEEV